MRCLRRRFHRVAATPTMASRMPPATPPTTPPTIAPTLVLLVMPSSGGTQGGQSGPSRAAVTLHSELPVESHSCGGGRAGPRSKVGSRACPWSTGRSEPPICTTALAGPPSTHLELHALRQWAAELEVAWLDVQVFQRRQLGPRSGDGACKTVHSRGRRCKRVTAASRGDRGHASCTCILFMQRFLYTFQRPRRNRK